MEDQCRFAAEQSRGVDSQSEVALGGPCPRFIVIPKTVHVKSFADGPEECESGRASGRGFHPGNSGNHELVSRRMASPRGGRVG